MYRIPKQKEFIRLMSTGDYTQKDVAKMMSIPPSTACRWAKKIPELQYYTIRNRLTRQLKPLSLKYGQNSDLVTQLIRDIEKMESLIKGNKGNASGLRTRTTRKVT